MHTNMYIINIRAVISPLREKMPSGRAAVGPDTMRQLTDIKLNNY